MNDRDIIRAMAKAERMMDSGELSFVWAPSPSGINERLAVTESMIKEFGLEPGQTINSIIRDALISYNLEQLKDKLNEIMDKTTLDSDFDFRDMMGDKNDNDD